MQVPCDNSLDAADWARKNGLPIRGETWEAAANETCTILERHGLEVLRLVRTPYLSQGASLQEGTKAIPFALDSAIFICQRARKKQKNNQKRLR